MTRQEAKAQGIQVVWVLQLASTQPPQYLRDYKFEPTPIWTADQRQAEPFFREVDAQEMARRISWLIRTPVEAVEGPVDPDAAPDAAPESAIPTPVRYCRVGYCCTPAMDDSVWCASHAQVFGTAAGANPSRQGVCRVPGCKGPVHAGYRDCDSHRGELVDRHRKPSVPKVPFQCIKGSCKLMAAAGSHWCEAHRLFDIGELPPAAEPLPTPLGVLQRDLNGNITGISWKD